MSPLGELVRSRRVVSLVGLSKNAGKTTALNHLLRQYREWEPPVAVTSIGRDGEETDLVTATPKPRVYVHSGCFFATAEGLLRLCDAACEILAVTDFPTALGRVVVARARSGGFAQLGGPSISGHLAAVAEIMKGCGASKVLVDGAISRKSASAPSISDGVVLCAGASLSSSMREVAAAAAHWAKMLALPVFCAESGGPPLEVPGAATDSKIRGLLFSGEGLEGRTVLFDEPGKILFGPDTYAKLAKRGAALAVRRRAELLAVTVNPVSSRGFSFPRDEFMRAVAEAVCAPVFDLGAGFAETAG